MVSFDLHKFVNDACSELSSITSARKVDFVELTRYLYKDIRSSMRKAEIKNLILEHYIVKEVLGSEARQNMEPEASPLTVKKQLEFERPAVEREKVIADKMKAESEKVKSIEVEKVRAKAEKERAEAEKEKKQN